MWRGFNITQEKPNREAIKEKLKERHEKFQGEISKKELAKTLDASPETVRRQAKKLKQSEEIKEVQREDSQRTFYAWKSDEERVSEDDEYLNEVKRARQKTVNILAELRQPTLEEVAFVGDFDSENKRFRKAYHYLLRKQENWGKPPENIRDKAKSKLELLIPNAKLLTIGETERAKSFEGWSFSAKEYAEKNKHILDDIDVARLSGKEDGKILGFELPEKLIYFTGSDMIPESVLKPKDESDSNN